MEIRTDRRSREIGAGADGMASGVWIALAALACPLLCLGPLGARASCGPGAAPLVILLLRRGTAVVQILTQPTNHHLALRLGHAALRH
jgi:hypothetical protein